MSRILVLYGTTDGRTEEVAQRIAQVLGSLGHAVDVTRAGEEEPTPVDSYDGVLVGGSIHVGSYQKAVTAFARRNRAALESMPSGLFTVCLTAAMTSPDADAHVYVSGFAKETGWEPGLNGIFGGALLYTKYGFAKRLMLRSIAKSGGLDVDVHRDWDYTDWDAVEAFAEAFSRVVASRGSD